MLTELPPEVVWTIVRYLGFRHYAVALGLTCRRLAEVVFGHGGRAEDRAWCARQLRRLDVAFFSIKKRVADWCTPDWPPRLARGMWDVISHSRWVKATRGGMLRRRRCWDLVSIETLTVNQGSLLAAYGIHPWMRHQLEGGVLTIPQDKFFTAWRIYIQRRNVLIELARRAGVGLISLSPGPSKRLLLTKEGNETAPYHLFKVGRQMWHVINKKQARRYPQFVRWVSKLKTHSNYRRYLKWVKGDAGGLFRIRSTPEPSWSPPAWYPAWSPADPPSPLAAALARMPTRTHRPRRRADRAGRGADRPPRVFRDAA